jgi:hypothetical protein
MPLPPAANLLPGVPLIESPFFDKIFVEGAFDPETLRIARDLHRDGYVVLDLPDGDFAARAERIKSGLHDRYDWAGWNRGARGRLRLQDAWASSEDVKSIAANPGMLGLLSTLYGRRAIPFQTLNFPVGTEQSVHSDAAHFSSVPERFMCGVWVALEDIGLEQGPLVYVPGSHAWPIYGNEHVGANTSFLRADFDQYSQLDALWKALVAQSGVKPQRFVARKGQALIWMANLLHGGDLQNDRSRTRWSQVTHYYFEGCSYYTPLLSDPFYGRIHFKDVRDISSGQPAKHQVGGHEVPEDFIKAAYKPVVRDRSPHQKSELPAGFDPAVYLRLNPDVAAAGADPRRHYIDYGGAEGRRWRD